LAGYCAFILPNSVDTENVATSYNAGVLKLELAKKPETQPKQIEIKAPSAVS
jgi:HSP20 family molecular chaperone IbpA